ncbi:MAG: xanthine dehydrogenase family protein molybdopterin-binding subunit [Candidatus Heimdallarchaeota archaeon]|nr:MAG: xanthine dehydrogenase family protein molybdopterin-binding subunit [Candidatus Heimdallarchaeota archaeon]
MSPYNIIGKSISRTDAKAKVTGSALYIDDLRFPRTLYLKVLRAGVPHAQIKSIDTSEAESLEGVYKIISRNTEGIYKNVLYGTCIFDQPIMAFEKVRHPGEVVAAVIAESEKNALDAIKKIKVELEELPFVLDPIEASSPEAPLIHKQNGEYKHVPTFVPIPKTNIFYKYQLKKGNHENVFLEADITVENEFEYPLLNHATIEPHGAVAYWTQTGDLHIWSSSQAPFVVREVLSDIFELPMNKIHINVPFLGGGFGGKSDYTIEPLLAACARYVPGHHVKFVLTRKEVFIGTVLGRGLKGTMKIGAKKDGTFMGLEAQLYFSDGAYGDTSCNVVLAAGHNCAGPYNFPNCNLKSYGVYTNTPPVGAMRGYGHPEGQFCLERLIEQVANLLGIDSKKLRMKNFLKPGDTNSLNQTITEHNGDIRECFEKMNEALSFDQLPEEDNNFIYGRGVAALIKSPVQTTNASSNVFLKFNEDLTVNISIGGVEMGQGCLTVLAQIAAEKLRIPVENIRINHEINTQITPYEWQTVASMTTMRVGNAILNACDKAITQFKNNAALVFNCNSQDLVYDGRTVSYLGKSIPLKELVLGYQYEDGHTVGDPILSVGSSVVRDVTFPDLETGQYQPYEWTFGAQGCDISIEKATGKIKVLHFVTALDIGRVINPETSRGQITGGVMMGIGAALKERILFDEKGIMRTKSLRKYQIPTLSDMPKKSTCILIENPQPNGPFGARPMAEHSIIGVPPAILNAFQHATGISLTKLPASPERVLEALKQRS